MPRKSKIQILPETHPEPLDVVEVSPSSEAQYILDCEFLKFLEEHAIMNKVGYEFKSEDDKTIFHEKYQDALNRIRAVFHLDEIQLSKSTLEREDKVKPAKKRVVKKKAPEEEPINNTFVVSTEHNAEQCVSLSVNPSVEKMLVELAKANRTLNRISSMVEAIPR
jgi:hypothetical protein